MGFRSPRFMLAVVLAVGLAVGLASCGGAPTWREAPAPRVGATEQQLAPPRGGDGPATLQTADGVALQLVAVRARGVVEDPLALTEIHYTFRNPEKRALEAHFQAALPPGATVTRFAVQQGWGWQEGEVVERAQARRVHEEALRARQAPALLEQRQERFSARVAGVPAGGEKTVLVAWTQELPQASTPYRVPLLGLPRLERLDVQVVLERPGAGAPRTLELKQRAWVPDRDFEVVPPPGRHLGLRHGRLAVARVTPLPDAAPDRLAGLLVLFDTSASRAPGFGPAVDRLGALLAALAPALPLRVACFDQTVEEVYTGPAGQAGPAVLARVRARGPFGASDLGRALRFAAAAKGRAPRVLLVTDGVATAGPTGRDALRAAAAALRGAGVERLDVVAQGGLRDEALLHLLVTAGLPRDGVVIDGQAPAAEAARRLAAATASGVTLTVPGSRWSWPTRLDGVQPGDQVLVYADLPAAQALEVVVGGARAGQHAVTLAPVPGPLLERAVAGARVRELVARLDALPAGAATRPALLRDLRRLSLEHRVLSDLTAMLVLDRDEDYARAGIDRRNLADILVVGKAGVEVLNRRKAPYRAALERGLKQAAVRSAAGAAPTAGLQFGSDFGVLLAAAGARETRPGGLASEAIALGVLGAQPVGGPAGPKARERELVVTGRWRGVGVRGGGAMSGARPRAPSGGMKHLDELLRRRGGSVKAGGSQIRMGAPAASGDLSRDEIVRTLRVHLPRIRQCYLKALERNPKLEGKVVARLVVGRDGRVANVVPTQGLDGDPAVGVCIAHALRMLRFPPPQGGVVTFTLPFLFRPDSVRVVLPDASGATGAATAAAPPKAAAPVKPPAPAAPPPPPPPPPWARRPGENEPHQGRSALLATELAKGHGRAALDLARTWQAQQPDEPLALLWLGAALEALGQRERAARVYGSLIDLFPDRADLRRLAGQRLERLGAADRGALELAIDTYRHARDERPDHPHGHRLLAYALLRAGDPAAALDALLGGLGRSDVRRFPAAERVLAEDAGLVAAAWLRRAPAQEATIRARLKAKGVPLASTPSVRLVLTWETDETDVDLHVFDAKGGHARGGSRAPASGGELFADARAGYGPECFAAPLAPGRALAWPLHATAFYRARGPFGFGAGRLHVVAHDGRGNLVTDERPFLVTNDRAHVDLGAITGPPPR